MPWKHRVIKKHFKTVIGDGTYEEDLYTLCEFYFDRSENEIGSWTSDKIAPQGTSLDELELELTQMLQAVREAKKDPKKLLILDGNSDII